MRKRQSDGIAHARQRIGFGPQSTFSVRRHRRAPATGACVRRSFRQHDGQHEWCNRGSIVTRLWFVAA